MKKLSRKSTASVHPVADYLPAAILTLAVGLPAEDKEVLAYLISCSSSSKSTEKQIVLSKDNNNNYNHTPVFTCSCFHCYLSYWLKWDSSINRDRIHRILDNYEDSLPLDDDNNNNKENKKKNGSTKRDRKKRKGKAAVLVNDSPREVTKIDLPETGNESSLYGEDETELQVEEEEEKIEKGSMRKFVSFLGDTFWAVWTTT